MQLIVTQQTWGVCVDEGSASHGSSQVTPHALYHYAKPLQSTGFTITTLVLGLKKSPRWTGAANIDTFQRCV